MWAELFLNVQEKENYVDHETETKHKSVTTEILIMSFC